MIIHNEIRKEVVKLLADTIQNVGYFHNGLPKIDDVENGLPPYDGGDEFSQAWKQTVEVKQGGKDGENG